MNRRQALASSLIVASGVLTASGVAAAAALTGEPGGGRYLVSTVGFVIPILAFSFVGWLISSRRPDNAIGWLLASIGSLFSVVVAGSAVSEWGLKTGSLPRGLAERMGAAGSVWVIALGLVGTQLLVRLPDGTLPSPRWRWFSRATVALITVAFVGMLTHQDGEPLWLSTAIFLLIGCFVVSIVALIVRYRRSTGHDRVQLRWVAFSGVVFVSMYIVSLPILMQTNVDSTAGTILTTSIQTSFAALPVGIGFAVLRQRLYDIDVVINRAVVFVVLVGFITAVYAGIVVGLGRLLPFGQGNLVLSVVATAVVAVVFEPVRVRVQHWANRLVYGRRASPYETLAAMTASIGESADPSDALGEAARLLAEGTGAAQAVVWVARDGVLTPRATAGDVLDEPSPVELVGGELPAVLAGVALVHPVRHEGKLVGALSLAKRPGEGVNTTDRRLVEELAGQAALLLANTRLRSRLGDRLIELRASRQRMITAQDRARHALERDLHDGAQQELVALKVKLGLARTIATREGDTVTAEQLASTVAIADRAVDTLRDVARGIYPPLLETEGLAAALSAQARRANLAVTVLDRVTLRYPRELEATAYFCALEALRNADKHAHADNAHIELDGTETNLVVTVTDDGDGFNPDHTPHGDGLTHMADRVDATSGTLTITSATGHGTTITLNLPIQPTDQPAPAAVRELAGATP